MAANTAKAKVINLKTRLSEQKSYESVTVPTPRNFEEVLESLGGFGAFQFLSLVLLLVLEIPAAFVSFTPVFVGGMPKIWFCDNQTMTKTEICTCNGTITAHAESIVAEWDLICGSAWVSDFITSLQMFGMFFGTLVACKISDWYGRRFIFLATVLVMAAGQALSAAAVDPYFYGFCRFLCGVGMSGFLGVSSVYTIEFQTPKWRPLCGSVGPWGEGVMLLALLAYFIRHWRILILVTSLPFLLIIVIFPFLPESPRWLVRNHKLVHAHRVMAYIAKVNGKPPVELELLKAVAIAETPKVPENIAEGKEGEFEMKQFGYLEFFTDPALRLPTIYQMTIMMSSAITYYGISFNVKNMDGSIYLIVMLLGLSDAIGYPSALLVCNRLGRRTSLAIYMSLGSVFLGTLAILELSIGLGSIPMAVIVLCLLGKFCVAGGRSCARTLVGELYPTAVRAMGSGLGGVGASLGAVLAPQLALIGSYWPAFPYFVFAGIAITGALFSFLLTETMGKPLTDQVPDVEVNPSREFSKKSFKRRRSSAPATVKKVVMAATDLSDIVEKGEEDDESATAAAGGRAVVEKDQEEQQQQDQGFSKKSFKLRTKKSEYDEF